DDPGPAVRHDHDADVVLRADLFARGRREAEEMGEDGGLAEAADRTRAALLRREEAPLTARVDEESRPRRPARPVRRSEGHVHAAVVEARVRDAHAVPHLRPELTRAIAQTRVE